MLYTWSQAIIATEIPLTNRLTYLHNIISFSMHYVNSFYNFNAYLNHIYMYIGKKNASSMQRLTLDEYKKVIQFENKPAAFVAFELLL